MDNNIDNVTIIKKFSSSSLIENCKESEKDPKDVDPMEWIENFTILKSDIDNTDQSALAKLIGRYNHDKRIRV